MPTPPLSQEEKQRRLDAIRDCGDVDQAAALLGINKNTLRGFLNAEGISCNAAKSGEAGLRVTGRSTLYGPDGEVKAEWVKTGVDQAQQKIDALQDAIAACKTLPRQKPVPSPKATLPNLCNVYTLTDCHIGMLSWPKETGAAWDLEIAERVLSGCFEQMVNACPPAQKCVIAQLGDWLHYDSLLPETPTSRHVLDADGRFPKMVQVAIRVLRRVIDYALERHEQVTVLLAEGNHDLASSVWLRCMFRALYENEPRVTVIDSEHPYYCLQHGETMLVWHHGHLKKPQGMVELAAAEFPKEWGATTKRYAHLGDKHHGQMKEHAGIIVEQHSTLASRDAYASRHGWQSLRRAIGITYHDKHGEVARATVSPEMLEDAAA